MGRMDPQHRPIIGQLVNAVKESITNCIEEKVEMRQNEVEAGQFLEESLELMPVSENST